MVLYLIFTFLKKNCFLIFSIVVPLTLHFLLVSAYAIPRFGATSKPHLAYWWWVLDLFLFLSPQNNTRGGTVRSGLSVAGWSHSWLPCNQFTVFLVSFWKIFYFIAAASLLIHCVVRGHLLLLRRLSPAAYTPGWWGTTFHWCDSRNFVLCWRFFFSPGVWIVPWLRPASAD